MCELTLEGTRRHRGHPYVAEAVGHKPAFLIEEERTQTPQVTGRNVQTLRPGLELLKCLPCKHEGLSLIPSTHIKSGSYRVYNPSTGELEKGRFPRTYWLASLA